MPVQSPAWGPLSEASPLLSPPTESSASDVNVTGDPEVPLATRLPLTWRPQGSEPQPLAADLITVPAGAVMVVSAAIVKVRPVALGSPIRSGRPPSGRVRSLVVLPARAIPLMLLLEPVLPVSL